MSFLRNLVYLLSYALVATVFSGTNAAQSQHTYLTPSDYVSSPRPIVFIPGIMGSRLFTDGEEIWGNASFDASKLIYDPNANVETEILDSISFLGAKMRSRAYGPFIIDHLNRFTTDLFAFSYDWRASNRTSAKLLNEFLCAQRSFQDEPIVIIAHSMGGLVFKHWIIDYFDKPCPDTNHFIKFERVMFVGTPHIGAPTAFLSLVDTIDLIGVRKVDKFVFESLNNYGVSFDSIFELLPFSTAHTGSSIEPGESCFPPPHSEHGLPMGVNAPRVYWRSDDGSLSAFDLFNIRFMEKLGVLEKVDQLKNTAPSLVTDARTYLRAKLDAAMQNTCRLARFNFPSELDDRILYIAGNILEDGISVDSTVSFITLSRNKSFLNNLHGEIEFQGNGLPIFIGVSFGRGDKTVPFDIATNGLLSSGPVRTGSASHLGLMSDAVLGQMIDRVIAVREANLGAPISSEKVAFMFEEPVNAMSAAGGKFKNFPAYGYLQPIDKLNPPGLDFNDGVALHDIKEFGISDAGKSGLAGGVLKSSLIDGILAGSVATPFQSWKHAFANSTGENWHMVSALGGVSPEDQAIAAVRAGAEYLESGRPDQASLVYRLALGDGERPGLLDGVDVDQSIIDAATVGAWLASDYSGPSRFIAKDGEEVRAIDAAFPETYSDILPETHANIVNAILGRSSYQLPEYTDVISEPPD